jgi:hypothetical protein
MTSFLYLFDRLTVSIPCQEYGVTQVNENVMYSKQLLERYHSIGI